MKAIWFGRHLYEPLLYLDQNIVEISPVPLNKGERNLVEDLKAFHDGTPEFFADKELYLLRNLSKGRGVGFFEAGNFHPDFILWLLVGGQQYIVFVDPKGIRNLGLNDPKIQFFETIKEIEQRLGDPSVTLSSFIVSNTPSHVMRLLWAVDKSAMDARNILFQEEDKATYVGKMMQQITHRCRQLRETAPNDPDTISILTRDRSNVVSMTEAFRRLRFWTAASGGGGRRPRSCRRSRRHSRPSLSFVSASPIAYGFGLDVFRNRQGMSSSIWLCGWPLMMASRVSAM